MKRFPLFIFLFLLAGCTASAAMNKPLPTLSAFEQTKLFGITAEAETQIAGYPKNDATVTAVMASKYAGGTSAAATMTAQPVLTPSPTIPPESPICRPADLKTEFGSSGATGSIMLGVGLTNISGSACFLQTWPQVILTDKLLRPLDVQYDYFELSSPIASVATQQAQEPESLNDRYGLLPGWTAWVNLDWQNWCGAPVSGGVIIQLTLLDGAGVVNIPTDIDAGGYCNAAGFPSSVGIAKIDQSTPPQ